MKKIKNVLGFIDFAILIFLITITIQFVFEKNTFYFLLGIIAFSTYTISVAVGKILEKLKRIDQ